MTMACPAILTSQQFLSTAIVHVDCQARVIGAYGFGALADPGSPVSKALAALLTIFIAVYGIRLLTGQNTRAPDLLGDVLRLGIALTLATSWPAWRVLGYDLVINGPADVVHAIGLASGLPGTAGDMVSRLQRIDEGLATFNVTGSGRLGVAQGDWFQLGFARSAFLVGTLAPIALVRLTAGILLALAPLMAGLLLFGISRPVFIGWVRGLVMVFLASITLAIVHGAELAMLEPWLADALARRAAEQQTLDAPVEVLVVTLVFALVAFGTIAIAARMAFQSTQWLTIIAGDSSRSDERLVAFNQPAYALAGVNDDAVRAQTVAHAVTDTLRREERFSAAGMASNPATIQSGQAGIGSSARRSAASDALGSSYRRNTRRASASAARRDQKR